MNTTGGGGANLAVDDDPAVVGGVVERGLLHAVQLRQRRHLRLGASCPSRTNPIRGGRRRRHAARRAG
jgi:hypothetical protein